MKKTITSPVGNITITQEDGYLREINIDDNHYDDNSPLLEKTADLLKRYFDKERICFDDLPIKPKCTVFQSLVYDELRKVPYGSTASYKDIATKVAKRMGKDKMSAQAVGTAVGKNPLLIVVPCHRIINHDGRIGGFSIGIERKKILMDLEDIKHD